MARPKLMRSITVPGRPDRLVRRTIYDAFGPAARASGPLSKPSDDERARLRRSVALFRGIDLLPAGCIPSWQFALHDQLTQATRNTGVIKEALAASTTQPREGFQKVMRLPWPASDLLALACGRTGPEGLTADGVVVEPNLFAMHHALWLDRSGALFIRNTIDRHGSRPP